MAPLSTFDNLLSLLSLSNSDPPALTATAAMEENITPLVLQPASRLLTMPPELRLQIYDYMTLSPVSEESTSWKGAYFASRQLQSEMKAHLRPQDEADAYLHRLQGQQIDGHTITLRSGLLSQKFGLLQDVTLYTRSFGISSSRPVLQSLYELYLDHLTIILSAASRYGREPYEDLKSIHPQDFMNYVIRGRVNCKKVTISIERLVNAEGGRVKSTSLENVIKDLNIPYTLTIVQDKDGNQSERTYSSRTRFRSRPATLLDNSLL